jgi:hypothetical protein
VAITLNVKSMIARRVEEQLLKALSLLAWHSSKLQELPF